MNIYKLGVAQALESLGFKHAGSMSHDDRDDAIGDPFPKKSPTIPAELFTEAIQNNTSEDHYARRATPENGHYVYDKPVTWGGKAQLGGLDGQQRIPGLMMPYSV